jgi:outer membrane immunogenic protein
VTGTTLVHDTRLGWIVGGGAEYRFAPNWSAKLEYNYLDFGTEHYSIEGTLSSIETQAHLVKVGFNYRLGWPTFASR